MKWVACELHTHTVHSDGRLSVGGLVNRAKSLGLEMIALTDHNTNSGLAELDNQRLSVSFPVIRGIEWTTYFGHVLVIGSKKYVDWRDAVPHNIDEKITMVHDAGGLVGIAHPYAPGEPVCCGYHWEFYLKDWDLADFIEIWSGSLPQLVMYNKKAIKKWTSLLDKEIYLTAISARDWHGDEDDTKPFGVTYLLLDEMADVTEAAKDALKNHRAYVTVGPTVSLSASSNGKNTGIGGTLPRGKTTFRIAVGGEHRKEIWCNFDLVPQKIVLVGVGGRELSSADFVGYENEMIITVPKVSGWVRVELRGTMRGEECALAVTNPITFE